MTVGFGEGITGLRDGWVKWSHLAPDAVALRALVADPADDWIFVAKRRRLRKFAIDEAGLHEVDAAAPAPPPRGCQFELSIVRSALDPGPLTRSASLAYPAWLLTQHAPASP